MPLVGKQKKKIAFHEMWTLRSVLSLTPCRHRRCQQGNSYKQRKKYIPETWSFVINQGSYTHIHTPDIDGKATITHHLQLLMLRSVYFRAPIHVGTFQYKNTQRRYAITWWSCNDATSIHNCTLKSTNKTSKESIAINKNKKQRVNLQLLRLPKLTWAQTKSNQTFGQGGHPAKP